jgi:hypothetical protein
MLLVWKMVHGSSQEPCMVMVFVWYSPGRPLREPSFLFLSSSICKRYAIYRVAPGNRTISAQRYAKSLYSLHMRKR